MVSHKIDLNRPNGEIGINITASEPFAASDTALLPQVCDMIKCTGTPGNVRYVNADGETHNWYLETGETSALVYKQILATGTVASGLYWGITGDYIKE